MQNKGLEETLILTWLDGFWDLGEGKLGNGCGCILWYCKSIKFTVTGFMFSICNFVISYNSSLHIEETCCYQLEIVIHHSGVRCCGITYRWVNIDKRLTEDMSCRAAAWGPQWAHWADTETVRLATTTWRQLLVRGQFKEPGFCLLCSHCLPVRGWAPKENKGSGSPDVYICACVSCPQANTHIWPFKENVLWCCKGIKTWRKGISDFMERVISF